MVNLDMNIYRNGNTLAYQYCEANTAVTTTIKVIQRYTKKGKKIKRRRKLKTADKRMHASKLLSAPASSH